MASAKGIEMSLFMASARSGLIHRAQWIEIDSLFMAKARSESRFCCHLWQMRALDRDVVAIHGKSVQWIVIPWLFIASVQWIEVLSLFMARACIGSRFRRYS